nr:hypothetical protein [Tanacetum cinerariifolium]
GPSPLFLSLSTVNSPGPKDCLGVTHGMGKPDYLWQLWFLLIKEQEEVVHSGYDHV